MQKLFVIFSLFLSSTCFANLNMSLESLAQFSRKVGDMAQAPAPHGWRVARVAKVAATTALLLSLVSDAEGGLAGCASAIFCEGGCLTFMAIGCNPAAFPWYGLCGPAGAAIISMCTVGAIITEKTCVGLCVAPVCSPLTP